MRFLSPLSLIRNPNPSFFRSLLPIRSRFSHLNRDRDLFRSIGCLGSKLDYRRSMAVVGTAAQEGSAARRFWIRSQKEVVFAAYTPFVVCLAAGRLDVEAFRQSIAQDVHFLRAFASAYEMAAEYADDDDDKVAILDLKKVTLEELKLHDSVMKLGQDAHETSWDLNRWRGWVGILAISTFFYIWGLIAVRVTLRRHLRGREDAHEISCDLNC